MSKDKDKNKIKVPEGSDGQQPDWPGDGHAPKSGTTIPEDNGDKTKIPIVR